jgi:ribosomal protein S18 acetylase RimI-like enzyme
MTYQLSKATSEDAKSIAVLVNSAYRGDHSRKGWTTEADLLDGTRIDERGVLDLLESPQHSILLCHYGADLFGCVEIGWSVQGKLYLGMLTVSPEQQGHGIGKILMQAAANEAMILGCHTIYMTVISQREELIAWYERQGFKKTGERKPFSFNDPRFGLPKMPLEFIVLEKKLN